MPIARTNGQPQDVVRHLVTKCGVHVDVAERLVPNREGVEDSPRTALTPDALDRYRSLVHREYADEPVLRTVLLLLPLTGLRIAEICGLTTSNVHREGDKISWTFLGKGSKERTVPLWRKARRVFEPYMSEVKPGYFVFPNKTATGTITPATVQEACRHLASLDPALKHLTPHVLRHTFATMALLNCHDIKRTQEILGHGKKNTVKIPVVMLRYLHPDVERSTPNSPRTLAVRKNPGQTTDMQASDDIYQRLKSGESQMIPVPGKRNRVWVYSRRRDDVVEVSEDRARTWLALGETMRGQRASVQAALRERYGRSAPPAVEVMPEPAMLVPVEPLSAEPLVPAKRTRAKKAKENPMRDDDWYWNALYSKVPPGPQRAHPVAQRNGKSSFSSNDGVTRRNPKEVHYTSKGQPYVYENGRPKFIKKSAAARRNPAGAHGAFDQEIEQFGVMERKFQGEQPYARRNSAGKVHYTSKGQPYVYVDGRPRFIKKTHAKKNNHRVWEQIIDPFSVTEARTYGRQPIGRRNPAGAHGAFDQEIEQFGVMERRFQGEQPYARRNGKKKSKAKKNGVVRIYEVK
jgi:site-specific recombinase XerC